MPACGIRGRCESPTSSPTGLRLGDAGGENLNGRAVGSLEAEIECVRGDDDFTARAKLRLERDREILDRLAE
jgi:hypothetical protein